MLKKDKAQYAKKTDKTGFVILTESVSPACLHSLLIHFCSVKRLEPGSSGKKSLPALGSWTLWGTEGTFTLETTRPLYLKGPSRE